MAPVSLNPHALYEDVATLLRQSIYSRELVAGSWIDELKIAAEFGVSRTPLREALKVLAGEGLVTMKVRRGAYVAEVSERDIVNIYHLLALLEGDAARVVATQASDAQLTELGNLHCQMEESVPDLAQFVALNRMFHLRLVEMANSRWRNQMVSELRKVMNLSNNNTVLPKISRVQQSIREHHNLMEALLAKDANDAFGQMKIHFASELNSILPGGLMPTR